MEISHLSDFVETRVNQLNTRFTLNGQPVTSADMASEIGLLPLVVMQLTQSIKSISDEPVPMTQLLEPADPQSHFLSSRVIALPDMPDGLLHLHINNAILCLAREPAKQIELPRNLAESSLPEISELSAHIAQFPQLAISPMASRSNDSGYAPR
jgi:hypothetical protein